MNNSSQIRMHKVFDETAVVSGTYTKSVVIPLEYNTNNYTMSYVFECWGSGATFNMDYETSPDSKNWYAGASTLVTGQTTSGTTFNITGGARANPTVFSGTTGFQGGTSGEYVVFSALGGESAPNETLGDLSDWASSFEGITFPVTSTASTLTVDIDSSGFTQEYPALASGTAAMHFVSSANMSSQILSRFIRFKVEETSDTNSGNVTLYITTQ